ncbi:MULTISPECIES: hypothetical protein [unclassified Dietzia]|uniref:hypothetical protein n=1 Tax=unclassified Dietzia TaxID=2617939 RepID=UPI0015FC153A|nr:MULTISPECIES: hypothetical protein [unclassified Dietzia]MBB1022955.1 hypothetical protein [Dietzia sp. DQ12-76]MBB1026461.1 hypothetical protein [Dietzia sp. DQ11-38-2]
MTVEAPSGVTFSTTFDDDPDSEFARIIAAEWPDLEGKQTPWALQYLPGDFEAVSEKVCRLYSRIAGRMMPWQRMGVDHINAVDEIGRWTHKSCVLVCPRQNGKTEIIIATILFRLFKLGHKILYTSLEWDSAKEVWERLEALITAEESLDERVVRRGCSQGRGTFILDNGGRLICRTRSAKVGRGMTKFDLVIIDEALDYTSGDLAALSAVMQASNDPQTIYATSAVNAEMHPHGVLISGIREAVLQGRDTSTFYAEWAAPEGAATDDPMSWRAANPAFGLLNSDEKVRAKLQGLPTEEARRIFAIENLGHGMWFSLAGDAGGPAVVEAGPWVDMVDDRPERVGHSALVVEADPDRAMWTVAAGVMCADDVVHVTVGLHAQLGVREIADWVAEAVAVEAPSALVVDPRGPAGVLIPLLEERSVDVMRLRPAEAKGLPEVLAAGAEERLLTRDPDPLLDEALPLAQAAHLGTASSTWIRRPGTCQIVALSLAAWAVRHFPPLDLEEPEEDFVPGPVALPSSSSTRSGGMPSRHRARAMAF